MPETAVDPGTSDAEVAQAAARYRFAMPRTAQAGRTGGVLGRGPGGSMELLDFREYQPGDDVRQLDWNAAARLDTLVVRVRREEVAPRVEVLLDASKSMATDPQKERRARQLADLACRMARRDGLEPTLLVLGDDATPFRAPDPFHVARTTFDGRRTLADHLARGLKLRPCGIRVVVSDFLFEAPLDVVCRQLSNAASLTVLLPVLSPEDRNPAPSGTIALVDSETGEKLERQLSETVLASYQRRLAQHLAALEDGARRARAVLAMVDAEAAFDTIARSLLGKALEVRP